MEKVTVTLGERSYPITIDAGLFQQADAFSPLKAGDKALIVTNDAVAPLYLTAVTSRLESEGIVIDSLILPDGEQYKTLSVMDRVFTKLLENNHGRDTTLIALGGGVIGDLTVLRLPATSAAFALFRYRRHCCLRLTPP